MCFDDNINSYNVYVWGIISLAMLCPAELLVDYPIYFPLQLRGVYPFSLNIKIYT